MRPELPALASELAAHTVIVEGKRDVAALRLLGVQATALNGRPLDRVAASLEKEKEIVILTDFDRPGKRLAAKLLPLLHRQRIRTNRRLRTMVRALGITRIEELRALPELQAMAQKGDDFHGESGTHIDQVHHQGEAHGKRAC